MMKIISETRRAHYIRLIWVLVFNATFSNVIIFWHYMASIVSRQSVRRSVSKFSSHFNLPIWNNMIDLLKVLMSFEPRMTTAWNTEICQIYHLTTAWNTEICQIYHMTTAWNTEICQIYHLTTAWNTEICQIYHLTTAWYWNMSNISSSEFIRSFKPSLTVMISTLVIDQNYCILGHILTTRTKQINEKLLNSWAITGCMEPRVFII